jgi:hypothetical protein
VQNFHKKDSDSVELKIALIMIREKLLKHYSLFVRFVLKVVMEMRGKKYWRIEGKIARKSLPLQKKA